MNVYYNPESFELEPLEEIEHSDGCYQFDTQMFWKHIDGRVFFAEDSGCSCPCPFEGYKGLPSLELVTAENFPEFEKRVLGHEFSKRTALDLTESLKKVRKALVE